MHRIALKHSLNQFFKILLDADINFETSQLLSILQTHAQLLFMQLPEFFCFVLLEKLEVSVIRASFLERFLTHKEHEQDDACGKDVNIFALIRMALKKLWCSVAWRTNFYTFVVTFFEIGYSRRLKVCI